MTAENRKNSGNTMALHTADLKKLSGDLIQNHYTYSKKLEKLTEKVKQ